MQADVHFSALVLEPTAEFVYIAPSQPLLTLLGLLVDFGGGWTHAKARHVFMHKTRLTASILKDEKIPCKLQSELLNIKAFLGNCA